PDAGERGVLALGALALAFEHQGLADRIKRCLVTPVAEQHERLARTFQRVVVVHGDLPGYVLNHLHEADPPHAAPGAHSSMSPTESPRASISIASSSAVLLAD